MPPAPAERAWTVALRQKEKSELEIAIYDVIGQSLFGDGISAKDVLGRLRAAPAVQRISIRINSNGGLLDDAKAMINLLAERRSAGVFVEATIDGMAASAASYLTTVADRVVMPSNAFLMFHQARAGVFGDAGKFETLAKYLRTSNEQLAEAYAAASSRRGKTRSKDDYLAEFAKGDRYLTADEAIEWGLADERTEPIQVAACLADISSLESVPDALRSAPYVVAAGARLPNAVPNLPPLPATPAGKEPPCPRQRAKNESPRSSKPRA
jgi:ATP-dependent Clp protease protease subunit